MKEPKNIWKIANTGRTSSFDRLCPGVPSVEATLTKSRQGWNTKKMSLDKELMALCVPC